MDRKLSGYRGVLSPQQIAEGINAANKNSQRLARDSEIMYNVGRYPSATSLAILAIEESGKVSILRRLAIAADEKEVAECWRDYRSHKKKNISWIFAELVSKGARHLEDFRPMFDDNSDHPYILDQLKQLSFYTDCLGNAHWSIPEEVIDGSLAKSLIRIAGVFSKNNEEVTTKEIELWIKHMKPVQRSSLSAMRAALVDWQKDMADNGLSTRDENDMDHFVNY